MDNKKSKMVVMWLIVAIATAAAIGWWMSRDTDIKELNGIDSSQDLDAEFQQIDQDLKNL